MLVRDPNGCWHDLYDVDHFGTRPIVLLNEPARTVTVVYTARTGGGHIVYRQSPMADPNSGATIAFGPTQVLIDKTCNNVTSTKQNWTDEVVVVASTDTIAFGAMLRYEPNDTENGLVAHLSLIHI